MAPAAASNWLSFSLSPMDMLAMPAPHHHQYYLDSFYSTAEWGNSNQKAATDQQQQNMGMYTDYSVENPTTVPKLEDFFCDNNNNNTASYKSQQTDDSCSQLTHIYDNNNTGSYNYFAHEQQHQHQQDLKAAMASFSANSGSEVDDSGAQNNQTQLACAEYVGQSIESAQPELVHAYCSATANSAVNGGSLSLSVVPQAAEKALAVVNEPEKNSNKKVADTFGQRTSIYRGVTRHRWTGRYEAHLWDNSCRREGQARKGRQVYLGGYDKEDKAARAYDLAALKYWGPSATTNFPISSYTQEVEDMNHVTKQEFIASLRRKSSGFSRGASIYRGVTRHHQQGRWQARIGRVAGNKDLYLGTFATEEEAAEAYDIAAIKFRGVNAVTNFEMNRYDVDAILRSNLPIGGAAKRLKLATEACEQKPTLSLDQHSHSSNGSNSTGSTINFAGIQSVPPLSCSMPYDTATAIFHQNLLHHLSSNGGGHVVTSDSYGSGVPSVAAAMALMPQTPTEFYIWPQQHY